MNKLSVYLQNKLAGYGERTRFSKHLGMSASTVTKWISGENAPDFENCLRIAEYFNIDPVAVFDMVKKGEYSELYDRFFRRSKTQDTQCSELYRRFLAGSNRWQTEE